MGLLKKYVAKRSCRTTADLIYRIQKFFAYKLTVDLCRRIIMQIKTVLKLIIEQKGGWSGC